MKVVKKIILFIIMLFIWVAIYATFIEPRLLVVKKYNMNCGNKGSNNIKIVQFTDTQLGQFYTLEDLEKAVNKINKQNADIVLFTGDLIDNASKYEEIDKVVSVLSKVHAKYAKYAIYGNHDYGGGAVRYYSDIMQQSGFQILVNEGTSIDVNGKKVNILGADDGLIGGFNVNDTVSSIKNDSLNILMLHEPDLADEFKSYPVDLILSGHSHGGQVYIPFYGPIKKNALSEKYTKGLYKFDNERGTRLYVNSGLGNTKVPFRLFNMPQITVISVTY